MKFKTPKAAPGFQYSDAPQRSPEWLSIRAPRIGASQLGAWMSRGVKGQYLKPHYDLEDEIAFSKAFGVPFSKFKTEAMQAGIDNEDFVLAQYAVQIGVIVEKCGCFYNDYFVASPDGLVGNNGLVEVKWLFDSNWAEVVKSMLPLPEHYLQMQGQMLATGRAWVDYVAANGNTNSFIVIKVKRNVDVINDIIEATKAVADIEPMSTEGIYTFKDATTEGVWE